MTAPSPPKHPRTSSGIGAPSGSTTLKGAYRDPWKATKRGLAHAEEMQLRLSAHFQRVLSRSRVSNPGSRANPDLDHVLLKKIAGFMRFGAQVALTGKKPSPVHKLSKKKRKTSKPKRYQKRLIREANKRIQLIGVWAKGKSRYRVWFKTWDHVSALVKAMAYGMAIPEQRRQAFTLKLSDEVIAMALKSPKGFAGFLQDRIARFLRNALPDHPPINFVFVIEAWHKWERPHLQGAIDLPVGLPDEDDLLSDQTMAPVKAALRMAGGTWRGRRSKQVHSEQMYETAGWFAYLGKRRLVTERSLKEMRQALGMAPLPQKEGLVAATQPLRQAGKRWFETAKITEEYVLRDRRWAPPAP